MLVQKKVCILYASGSSEVFLNVKNTGKWLPAGEFGRGGDPLRKWAEESTSRPRARILSFQNHCLPEANRHVRRVPAFRSMMGKMPLVKELRIS